MSRYGAWRIGGMNNAVVGGQRYTGSARAAVSGQAWSELVGRDPFLTKWNAVLGTGTNYAPPIHLQNFGLWDRTLAHIDAYGDAHVFDRAAQCTTTFIDKDGGLVTDGLEPKSLRPGIRTHRPYVPCAKEIPLEGDGPGTNMTGKSGAEIVNAVKAGAEIYLGPGTYHIGETLRYCRIWGAGKDRTILVFDEGVDHCLEGGAWLYNLTIEGGQIGFEQTEGFKPPLSVYNVRFRNQNHAGLRLHCAQAWGIAFAEFDNCNIGILSTGSCKTIGMNDNKIMDKVQIYGCIFRNLEKGLNLNGGDSDGYISAIGCRFENITDVAVYLRSNGNYISGCDFINVATAVYGKNNSSVNNCYMEGTGSGTAIKGEVKEILSTNIKNFATPIELCDKYVFVSDVVADGPITPKATTWVGLSKFSDLDVSTTAQYGNTSLSQWTDDYEVPIPQNAPSAPTSLSVEARDGLNVLTWAPSTDNEAGVLQYIIERNGVEIGRTDYDHSANYYLLLQETWGPGGWPGAGVNKNKTTFTDTEEGSASKYTADNYEVIAVNSAQIRSDGAMAQIALFPHEVTPFRLYGDGSRLADTVRITFDRLKLEANDRTYTAVKYAAASQSGMHLGYPEAPVAVGLAGEKTVIPNRVARRTVIKEVTVRNLKGAVLAKIRSDKLVTRAMARGRMGTMPLAPGVYIVPELDMKVTIAARNRAF